MSGQKNNDLLKAAFDGDAFRRQGYQVVDMLADYLNDAKGKNISSVLPDFSPDEMLKKWKGRFEKKGMADWQQLLEQVLDQSNHIHHPGYIGHQVTPPLPLAALMDFAGLFLNNGSAIYEMGPVNVIMERRVIEWMVGLIGYPGEADGIFTSGGTLGNLTALLAARQSKAGYNIWQQGVNRQQSLSVFISEQAHYSVKRAVGVMGLGEDSVVKVPVDSNFRIDISKLPECYSRAKHDGKRVFALVANGCSTATGSYDHLDTLADFCQQEDIWLHVDGAHGASALLSDRYRSLMKGVHRADSIVWDAHKMLLMPSLTTAVIFKDGARSYDSFSQEAAYLFEKEAREEWYNYAHRTMECTKKMMGLKLYVCLSVLGQDFFAGYVERMYDLSREFAGIISGSGDFQLAVEPQSNIVCFRYLKSDLSGEGLNRLQSEIRKQVLGRGLYYIVQTRLKGAAYLRCTIINPLTTLEDLTGLLDHIRAL